MRIKLRHAFFFFSGRCKVIHFLLKCHCLIMIIVHIKKEGLEKAILILMIRIYFNVISKSMHTEHLYWLNLRGPWPQVNLILQLL